MIFGRPTSSPAWWWTSLPTCWWRSPWPWAIDRLKQTILDLLVKVLAEDGIAIRGVYERSDAKVRLKEGMERVKGFLSEPFDPVVEIVENGIRYQVDVAEGRRPASFWIRSTTAWLSSPWPGAAGPWTASPHTGAFALNAAKGGAAEVIGVDASQLGVDQAAKNAALNGMSDRVRFLCRDVFELLPELHGRGSSSTWWCWIRRPSPSPAPR